MGKIFLNVMKNIFILLFPEIIMKKIIIVLMLLVMASLATAARPKQVTLYFLDENNCSLDGYLFVSNELVGKTENGLFNLSYDYYKEEFDSGEINLFGKLGSCSNEKLFFDKYWQLSEIPEYYFLGNSTFKFKTSISPHNPSRKELLAFIQPDIVRTELENIKFTGNTLDDLSKINEYLNDKVNYTEDWDFNKEQNYWQTPKETLNLKQGDCEDYSTALLSLFLAYNNSLNCYNIVLSSHVTTMCHIGDYYIYYDQKKTELKKQVTGRNIETKPRLRALKEEYFEHYGINESEGIHYAFNEYRFIEFKNNEDFITWQAAMSGKSETGLFQQLENRLSGINITESYVDEELATFSPAELPTFSGFVREYYFLFIVLGVLALILIILLVHIIVKK